MNYRHSYHAGNAADVLKHYVLCEILASLAHKPAPFCVIDSHAGAGLYSLKEPGEFQGGIGQLWPERSKWPALSLYFDAIGQYNGDSLLLYPGSPLIIRTALRAQDRAIFLELHPEEYRELKAHFPGGSNVAVHHTDAWKGLKAFVPPRENRGLVLIDPPYERRDEFAQILGTLARALKHWRNGVYMIWYPIKGYGAVARFLDDIAGFGVNAVAIELLTLPLDNEQRLNGSGVVLINPPWKLPQTLGETLPPLATRLAGPTGRPEVRIRNLALA